MKLLHCDFYTYTKQHAIPYINADHILLKTVKELFDKPFEKRMVGVRFTDLILGNYQIDLFEDRQVMIKLYQAINRVKVRFGESYVSRASGRTRQ